MESQSLGKAAAGVAGIVIGAMLITALRVAAIDGVERERTRQVQELDGARARGGIVVAARGAGECLNFAQAESRQTQK